MDLNRINKLRRTLTAHFAIIAWLTAMLVATGSGTLFLPVFILLVSVSAFIFVDCLEWFELKSVGSTIGMCAATGIAITTYVLSVLHESESGQLLAVAGLLVYPEAVLFLQRKTLRIFEQLAVFLLLEMIVAALVNDNLMFGVMLAPIMLLWVSSLFLFTRYATLVRIDPSIEQPLPKLAEVLLRRFMKSVLGESPQKKIVTSRFLASQEVQSSRTMRRSLQSIPIGIGALAFAALFFYLLPRTSPDNLTTTLGKKTRVGLPSRLTFGNVGKILQNPTPVMRVKLSDPLSRKPFKPESPPYLRARVFNNYGPNPRQAQAPRGEWGFIGQSQPRRLGRPRSDGRSLSGQRDQENLAVSDQQRIAELRKFGRDLVAVEFDLRREFASALFVLPPIFRSAKKQSISLNYDERYMILQELDDSALKSNKSIVYDILSAGFYRRHQLEVTPATLSTDPTNLELVAKQDYEVLTQGFERFFRADEYRKDLIQLLRIDESNKARVAMEFEQYLAFSGKFSYSLDLAPPSDQDMDPLEDFLVNRRVGHCQYFASAMVCLLRQSGIPSRLVIGYRPTEFNAIGKYFLVRQSDAHAWVEALFRRAELVGTEFESMLTDSPYYWVRFDPTPPPDGELTITDQQGQAIDYAEKLWKDYVVEGQNLAADSGLYAPVAENQNAYEDLVSQLRDLKDKLTSGEIFRGEIGFAWPIAFLTIGIGFLGLVVWQFAVLLPKFAPGLARRIGLAKGEIELKHPFYARCLKLIQRLGIRRDVATTPQEFTETANQILKEKGLEVGSSLGFLTELYYRLRFGLASPSAASRDASEERRTVEGELRKLEQAVDAASR